MLSNDELKINRIFSNLEGGPRTENFENQDSRRSHLRSDSKDNILPLVNDPFQRILLRFIACSFLNIKFRHICILPELVDLLCFCSVLCLLCFVRVCLYVLRGHLLGKG